eukprot:SAG22_NODE_155_length_17123_cov_37.528489_12_plen_243_part_00
MTGAGGGVAGAAVPPRVPGMVATAGREKEFDDDAGEGAVLCPAPLSLMACHQSAQQSAAPAARRAEKGGVHGRAGKGREYGGHARPAAAACRCCCHGCPPQLALRDSARAVLRCSALAVGCGPLIGRHTTPITVCAAACAALACCCCCVGLRDATMDHPLGTKRQSVDVRLAREAGRPGQDRKALSFYCAPTVFLAKAVPFRVVFLSSPCGLSVLSGSGAGVCCMATSSVSPTARWLARLRL